MAVWSRDQQIVVLNVNKTKYMIIRSSGKFFKYNVPDLVFLMKMNPMNDNSQLINKLNIFIIIIKAGILGNTSYWVYL
jgi:hypothetical protein